MQPPADLVDSVEHAMARRATHWHKPHTGLSAAHRFAVTFDDGTAAFVKAATDVQTSEWLRTEHTVLAAIEDDFTPTILHWHDGLLITEDLTGAYWPADHPGADGPVTWLPRQIDALTATLRRVAGAAPDLPLPAARPARVWPRIAVDPRRFGVAPHLVEPLLSAEAAAEFDGDALVHNDVRSDNVCFAGERVVLVDWSTPHRGNALVDVAQLAPTLAIEGGPDPYDVLRDAPLAAWQAGVLLVRAANAEGPAWLCDVLRRLADVALVWATRCLSLD